MNLLDECYISFLNLDKRLDRLEHMQKELARVGITAERTRGQLPDEFDSSNPNIQVMLRRTPGAVGCHFGQTHIMQEAFVRFQHAFVMEDDLIICSDIKERLNYIDNYLQGKQWDVVFLGGTVHVNPAWWHKAGHSPDLQMCNCELGRDAELTDDPRILRTYGAFSTHCYIVNKDSIYKILEYFYNNVHLSMGIDWLFIKMQPKLKAYMFVPGCVKQLDNQSDIGNGITYFSGFSMLGEHWWQDNMNDFNPETYNWGEAKLTQ